MQEPNQLIHASSPYLLQHAYNPVEWYEWGTAALEKAKRENKLILVSIGYSACHWCHVMEHESFEDFEVAEVMNRNFVCIKVDREERPDIDQIYMLAVQLMNGNGGWPLNAICLPDQKPIYGGTYFRKNDWINILENVADLWKNEPEKAKGYANRLTDGIQQAEKIVSISEDVEFTKTHLQEIVEPWKRHFDIDQGGYNRAPKFPLPNNWSFLLKYSSLTPDEASFTAVCITLEAMAKGGIYDQVGGGFARYSVDERWHVPHFEKMLYDNAQLISLYAEAYQCLKFEPFIAVVEETIEWVFREMSAENGLFYSALDADSEGVEGKFYVWDKVKFDAVLGEDAVLLADYFNVTEEGNWEEEKTNILMRIYEEEDFLTIHQIDTPTLAAKLKTAKAKLLKERAKRVRPGLDDKCLTAWNAMMIKALAESSRILGKVEYYNRAKQAADFILENLVMPDGGLYRNYKNGKASIAGFLDDYAFMIEALIALYETDFNERWLVVARDLTQYVIANFKDADSDLFFYTAENGETLIARKHEVMDNVISASNSVMAQNLQKLGLLFDEERFRERASAMLKAVLPRTKAYGSAYANWSMQLLNEVYGLNEVAIVGSSYEKAKAELDQLYIPNKIVLGGVAGSLPLLLGKLSEETKIFVCKNKTCQLPVGTVTEAVKLMR